MRITLVTVLVAALGSAAGALSSVPVPAVTLMPAARPGSAAHDYPFFATDIVLSNYGYVEEEFSVDGVANTYQPAPPNANAEIASRGIKYRSRLLVRRPAQANRFNGVVVVEWLNVTNGYDTDVLWLYEKEFLIREGYAWVGVSAQNVGVSRPPNGLKVWSPARYGTLDIDGGGQVTGDALGYDIYSQAAMAIRSVPRVLGGLRARHVIAAGQSQSAGRLVTYLNGVHERDPVFDAAMLTVNTGLIRTDLSIPVIKVLSETEANTSRNQPDSARIRVWIVTGSTHSEQYSLISRAAFLKRDLNLEAVDPCETPARSRVEIRYVYNAAIDALVKWKTAGTAPPSGPPLTFAGDVLQRDPHGNALGGIRLAEIAAPVATEAAGVCGLGGKHVPFDTATINSLYPTHDDYVSQVRAASEAMVKAGFLLPADAAQTIDAARRSIYGRQLTCGPLCADVRQFPANPSSILLSRQTAALLIKDGETLVKLLDAATLSIAEAYTSTDAGIAAGKFKAAASGLQSFIDKTAEFERKKSLAPETAALLVNQAKTLKDRVIAQAQTTR